MTTTNPTTHQRSVLRDLRSVIPVRSTDHQELLRLTELQANRLLALLDQTDPEEVPIELIASLPRIRIVYHGELPKSGASFWDGQEWIIAVNPRDSRARQRFTVFHEYKHVIDHGAGQLLYRGHRRASAAKQAEQMADYFAGCVLVSRRMLKRAWGEGIQRPRALAELFGISEQAIRVRLSQVGLLDERPRCAEAADLGIQPHRQVAVR